MNRKILLIEDWETLKDIITAKLELPFSNELLADQILLVFSQYELKGDVIEFKAKVKAKDLGGGYTTGPYRLEIPKNIDLKLGEYYHVFAIKEKD